MFLVALTILGATQAKAAACVAQTADQYVALGTTGCTIGSWTLSSFAFSSTVSGGTVPVASTLEITPLLGGGAGFMGSPTGTWAATTGFADVEIKYLLTFTNPITSIFQSISGSVLPNPSGGFDSITDQYCPGGTTLPPDTTSSCPGGFKEFETFLNPGQTFNSGSESGAAFSSTTVDSVAVLKDIGANATGFPGSTDTITSFVNCFNFNASMPCNNSTQPPVAEPSALLMLGSGLLGLALLSVRRRRIV